MFVRGIPEPAIDEIPFLIYLPIIINIASAKISLFNFLADIFFDSFATEFNNYINPLVVKLKTLGKSLYKFRQLSF